VTPSKDIDPAGSPGPRRRWNRKKKLGTTLALTAVIGLVGLAQASMASAATLGSVMVDVSVADANNPEAGRDTAFYRCQSWHSNTQSVRFDHSSYYYVVGDPNPVSAAQVWDCLDTP
jgi:hypothetical protein